MQSIWSVEITTPPAAISWFEVWTWFKNSKMKWYQLFKKQKIVKRDE
ncbi:hypothetical protein [Spiroplasma platyhelix]|nr:hypothetical protein [Spiroplasma platyhelix]